MKRVTYILAHTASTTNTYTIREGKGSLPFKPRLIFVISDTVRAVVESMERSDREPSSHASHTNVLIVDYVNELSKELEFVAVGKLVFGTRGRGADIASL